jgi:hypothetical protein
LLPEDSQFFEELLQDSIRIDRITHVDIFFVENCPAEIDVLINFVAEHRKLVHFHVHLWNEEHVNFNKIQQKFRLLCDALALNTGLFSLSLDNLQLAHENALYLPTMLTRCTRLASLSLFDNCLTAEHVTKISNVLVPSKWIRYVDFSGNAYEPSDIEDFLAIWKHNYSVARLEFDHIAVRAKQNQFKHNLCARNMRLYWGSIHEYFVDIYMVLAPLELPVYVLLWILDWLEPMSLAVEYHHYEKVCLLQKLVLSRRAVFERRQTNKTLRC